MKVKNCLVALCLAILLFGNTSCGAKKQAKDQGKSEVPAVSETLAAPKPAQPAQLPVRYQTPGFVTSSEPTLDVSGGKLDDYQMKVGASINSNGTKLELGKTMDTLARLKGMNVSWASDTNQYALVSVNISAEDNFFDAIKNLLRQVDHFYEVKGKTILIKDKDTKTYQIGVPSMKGEYTSSVGGNFLAARSSSSGTEGNVKIKSEGNKFDVWDNIEKNLNTILAIIEEGEKFVAEESGKIQSDREASAKNALLTSGESGNVNVNAQGKSGDSNLNDKKTTEGAKESSKQFKYSNRHTSISGEYFVIDKSIGLITVTAKPVNMSRVDEYINRLKKELFRQIGIEAKIIEVILSDNSKVGLDWSDVLKNFRGTVSTSFASDNLPHFTLAVPNFSVLLNALNEQGDTHVLANPKLTVLNGQPAIISVGQDIAYVKKVSKTTTVSGTGTQDTFTAEPDNVVSGIALGVMASIVDDKKMILHLTPITTDIQNLVPDTNGIASIPMTPVGDGSISLGLPQVRIREMSTMVQIEDGEMLVIGGLIDSNDAKNGAFAPGFGSLPVVKYLFGVETKTVLKRELVILLTPKII